MCTHAAEADQTHHVAGSLISSRKSARVPLKTWRPLMRKESEEVGLVATSCTITGTGSSWCKKRMKYQMNVDLPMPGVPVTAVERAFCSTQWLLNGTASSDAQMQEPGTVASCTKHNKNVPWSRLQHSL
jgi:hypothetical protein